MTALPLAPHLPPPPSARLVRSRAGHLIARWGWWAAACATPLHALAAEPANLPILIEAQRLSGQAEKSAQAEGRVEMRKGTLLLRADRVDYDLPSDRAVAEGHVEIRRPGSVFRGPRLEMEVQSQEGFLLEPSFDLERSRAGGRAQRVDFLGAERFVAQQPLYTSCPRDGPTEPDWLLTAQRLRVDLEANEAVAEVPRLRFLGLSAGALPVMSFPATSERKSGWLAPRLRNDSLSGLQVALPYYWNLAPDKDLTFTPYRYARRGAGLDTELRFLGLGGEGQWALDVLPSDGLTGTRRHSLRAKHEGSLPHWGAASGSGWWEFSAIKVSDTAWWKDFQATWLPLNTENDWWRDSRSSWTPMSPRLLPVQVAATQPLALGGWELEGRASSTRWQVLQSTAEPLDAPYEHSGLTLTGHTQWASLADLRLRGETGVSVFTRPIGYGLSTTPNAQRWHVVGHLSRRFETASLWVEPALSLNAASYRLEQALPDGRSSVHRVIPTLSIDAGSAFERDTVWFGRALRQTMEPRVMFVRTPYREQSPYLLFDSAPRDFRSSIFRSNDFIGIDRVPDAHHVNVGAVNRILADRTSQELFRLEAAQRFRFRDQRIPSETVSADAAKTSDLVVLAATSIIPRVGLSGNFRWTDTTQSPTSAIYSASYTQDPNRQLGLVYRSSRGIAQQAEASWRWTLGPSPAGLPGTAPSPAAPAFYPVSGRRWTSFGGLVYSAAQRQLLQGRLGLEVDAGCWSSRLGVIRQAAGLASITVVEFQLELKGLTSGGFSFR